MKRHLPFAFWAALLAGCTSQVDAQLDAAQLEMRQGAYEHAVDLYAEVLENVPRAPNIHTNMGFALLQLDRHAEALAHFETAQAQLGAGKADVSLLHNWASALERLDRLEEAEAKYAEAAQVDPGRASVLINWANLLGRMGRLDDAEQRYAQALAAEPESALAWVNRGYTLERLGRPEEALVCYRTFLTFSDDAPSDLIDHARRFVAQAEAAGQVAGG
ncbi:MAG: tetratricopeptide repeat protein [Nitrospirae bacterium]|nr:tetratricopeptide repeat protein [Nitrospirota bacterium]